jgi:hypothetical protein
VFAPCMTQSASPALSNLDLHVDSQILIRKSQSESPGLKARDPQIVTCSDYVCQRFSPTVRKDYSEEAATPEFPETRRSVFLKPSRQFTLGNHRFSLALRNLQQR